MTFASTTVIIALVSSPPPVGLRMPPMMPENSEAGIATTCTAMPMIAPITNITPKANQNLPRMSRQERTTAPRIVARSSTSTAGTTRSLVVSHTYSGMLPSPSSSPRITASAMAPPLSGPRAARMPPTTPKSRATQSSAASPCSSE